jgi:hypothetical protein
MFPACCLNAGSHGSIGSEAAAVASERAAEAEALEGVRVQLEGAFKGEEGVRAQLAVVEGALREAMDHQRATLGECSRSSLNVP